MRLSTALFTGSELSRVAGFNAETVASGGTWSSLDEHPEIALDRAVIEIGQGDETAVGLSVAVDITGDAVSYLRAQQLPVSRLIIYSPDGGPGWNSVKSPRDGLGLAHAIAKALREDTSGAPKAHLFQATPMPLSLMIGHLWNRMPATQLYDDLGPGEGLHADVQDRRQAEPFHLEKKGTPSRWRFHPPSPLIARPGPCGLPRSVSGGDIDLLALRAR